MDSETGYFYLHAMYLLYIHFEGMIFQSVFSD